MNQLSTKYDLEKRTLLFAETIIDIIQHIQISPINSRIVTQLIGSSGSVGANYAEAVESESKKDFIHKITISKKEIKETLHWILLLIKTNPEQKEKLLISWKEAHELLLIFASIVRSCKKSVQ